MFHTVRTKLNLVNLVKLSPIHSRAFSIYNTRVKDSSLNLGVLIDTRGGNRYQSSSLIWEFPSHHQVKLGLTRFKRGCCHVATRLPQMLPLFLGKSLIYKVCCHVATQKT
jgi:hypothetical protein